jgi:hypothetical protein
MKRFGLLTLLSACYALVLGFTFSTEYSRENSFLLPETTTNGQAKAFESTAMSGSTLIMDRIALLTSPTNQPIADAGKATLHELQSPESAGGN